MKQFEQKVNLIIKKICHPLIFGYNLDMDTDMELELFKNYFFCILHRNDTFCDICGDIC